MGVSGHEYENRAGLSREKLASVDPHAPLSQEAREAFRACIDDFNQRLAALRQQPQQQWARQIPQISPEQVEQSLRFLEGLRAKATTNRLLGHMSFALNEGRETLSDFVRRKDIQWIHVVRLLVLLGCLPVTEHDRFYFAWPSPYFHAFREAHPGAGGLREIAAAMQAAGLDDLVLGRALLTDFFWPTRWRDADTWPYFAERIVLLEEAFGLAPGLRVDSWWRAQYREHAFRVLKAFPHLPDNLAGKMWEIALGEGKTERPLAQAVLENTADVTDKVAAALADGKYATRATAAEWLGKLKATGCIPQLRKSLAKEKHDAAADAMMRALEALGVSAAEFLDRNALADDAAKGLKKRARAVLTWFPFDRLPDVHWHDTGEPVPRDVLVWFLIKAHKLNKPEPGPMLVRYCEMFRPAEREALGQLVLEAWIAQDTIPFTPQEARARAQREAAQLSPYFPGKSVAEVTESLYNQYCNSPSGSATSAKGILAVAGACCGERGVEEIGRYIHFWYGYRAAQCKALVATLASIEVRPAVQLLLSIANRFRTKGIREEAAKYVHVLAERKGWTVDQLADRMIPSGGLDDAGRLELDLGPRTLVARLDPGLKVILTGADGKPLKSFPKQGKQDDDEKYRQAKKLFSSAKQEVKTTVRRQTERLFEAMCTQRTWTFADWDTYLKGHPIVGNLCRRLVWAVGSGDEPQQWFRPMEDGSLTDCTDEEVHVDPAAAVRLAHDYNTSPDRATQWAGHLADYEIAPLFPQFGRDLYRLPEAMRDRTEITEFQGYLVQAFSLRGRATKLGYTRGETGDGGWFYQYQRHLPGLSLDVEIQFSGNALPEENRTVALKSLRFHRKAHEGGGPSMPIPLGDVPPVLLSECYNDLRSLAQLGTGFDPDWEKKVQ